jgi:hypothetical protein
VFDVLGGSILTDVLNFEERLFQRIANNRFDRDPVFIPAVILQDAAKASMRRFCQPSTCSGKRRNQ